MKLVEDYRKAGFCSDLVAVVDAKDAEIERLRAALKRISEKADDPYDNSLSGAGCIADEALRVNEQSTEPLRVTCDFCSGTGEVVAITAEGIEPCSACAGQGWKDDC